MKIALIIAGVLALLVLIGWAGLRVKPTPFPAHAAAAPSLNTFPLPVGLPAPVERFYRTVYGERVPIIETVIMTGRATIRPMFNIPLPARFVFVHNAGHDYRHYFEATFFGAPFLKVNEGYLDGRSFFESPMGRTADDANTNQGANLALWAEAGWFPALLVTDPRARWAPVDDRTALLYVPFEDGEECFVVRFNPEIGLIDMMEAMRYRDPGDGKSKILWISRNLPGPTVEGTMLPATGSATWLDQGRPWAIMTLESITYNADIKDYLRARGQKGRIPPHEPIPAFRAGSCGRFRRGLFVWHPVLTACPVAAGGVLWYKRQRSSPTRQPTERAAP